MVARNETPPSGEADDITLNIEGTPDGGARVVLYLDGERELLGRRAQFSTVEAAHGFRAEIFAARAAVRAREAGRRSQEGQGPSQEDAGQKEEEAGSVNKIDSAFEKAWEKLGDSTETDEKKFSRIAFAAGARAFSTMPLCKHGSAIWGIEHCPLCLEEPGAFPGYNRPFETELPEGMTAAHLEDLRVEHEALRRTLLQALVKVGVLSEGRLNARSAPWDSIILLQFAGLWLSDAMPWVEQGETHQELALLVKRLESHAAWTDQRIKKLEGQHEPAS